MFRRSFYFLFALTFLLAGCRPDETPNPTAHSPMERAWPVVTAEAEQQNVPVFIEAIGNVIASKSIDIRPQVGGKIAEIHIRGGDDVKAGDPLYLIDPVPYEVELAKAEEHGGDPQEEKEHIQAGIQYLESKLVLLPTVANKLCGEFYAQVGKLYNGKGAKTDEAKGYLERSLSSSPCSVYSITDIFPFTFATTPTSSSAELR